MIDRATVLIVVDVQNDFCEGGALAVPGGDSIVAPINALSRRFDHVILTQDWHPTGHLSFASSRADAKPFDSVQMPYGPQVLWPDHCVMGTRGAEFHPALDVPQAQAIIRKGYRREVDSYSGFMEADRKTPTGLGGYLSERGVTRVALVGLATDFCVHWTAVDARAAGLETMVIADACRAINMNGSLQNAEEAMLAAGVRLVRIADVAP